MRTTFSPAVRSKWIDQRNKMLSITSNNTKSPSSFPSSTPFCHQPNTVQSVYLAVEPHAVAVKGGADGDGGGGAEVIGIKRDAYAIVDWQDQGLVPLPPVFYHRYICRRLRRHHHHPFSTLTRHSPKFSRENKNLFILLSQRNRKRKKKSAKSDWIWIREQWERVGESFIYITSRAEEPKEFWFSSSYESYDGWILEGVGATGRCLKLPSGVVLYFHAVMIHVESKE